MWTYFPISVGLRYGRGGYVLPPAPTEADPVPIGHIVSGPEGHLYLTAKATPEGGPPVFPTGAEIDVWYFTGHNRDDDPDPYGIDRDASRSVTTIVSLNGLSWTWDSENNVFVSNAVLTLPSSSARGWWVVPEMFIDYVFDEDGNYLSGGWVPDYPNAFWEWDDSYGTENMVRPGSGIVKGGNAAATAFICGQGGWMNAPRGRFVQFSIGGIYGNESFWTYPLPAKVATKASLGLFAAYDGSSNYYRNWAITTSTDPQYPTGDPQIWWDFVGLSPTMKPVGYSLTSQTATRRTWTRGDNTLVLTLSNPVTDFSEWFPADYLYYGNSTVKIQDHVDFLTAQLFPVGSDWKVIVGYGGSFADLDFPNGFPDDIGTVTLLLWSEAGMSTVTLGMSKHVIDGYTLRYESDAWPEGKHPVAVIGLTGQLATGWLDNGNYFAPWGALKGVFFAGDSVFARIPVPTSE